MRHDVTSGLAPAVIREGPQYNCCVSGEGRFHGLSHGIKSVPPQEQGVVGQCHAVLAWPRRRAEPSGAVDEHYPLLEHDPTLFHGTDIPTR
jgi:hypothetical protein